MTKNEILALGPCHDYTEKRLEELARGRESVSLPEILRMEEIPLHHRVWLLSHSEVWANPKNCHVWMKQFVTRAITNNALHCGVPEYERWAENWLDGSDRTAASADRVAQAAYWGSDDPKRIRTTWAAEAAYFAYMVEIGEEVAMNTAEAAYWVYRAADRAADRGADRAANQAE